MADRRSWKARQVDAPEPGFYRRRLVRRGPLVPCRITFENGVWRAQIGREWGIPEADALRAEHVIAIWHSGEIIDEDEHRYLLEVMSWVHTHAPDDPLAKPTQPVDLAKMKPPF